MTRRFLGSSALVLFLALSLHTRAQSSATVSGTITDVAGAVMPGVSVTATNIQTGVVTTEVSSVMTNTARQGIFRYFEGWNPGHALTTTSAGGATPTIASVDLLGNPVAHVLRCFSVCSISWQGP
jgi:hypothetical protein